MISKAGARLARFDRSLPTVFTDMPEGADLASGYTLHWRQRQLWIRSAEVGYDHKLPSLQNQLQLIACLQRSSIKVVCLDPQIGPSALRLWAETCKQSGKTAFLRPTISDRRSSQVLPLFSYLYRVLNQITAILLLIMLSPLLLSLVALIYLLNSDQVFQQGWRIGRRGKLFLLWNFYIPTLHHSNGQAQFLWIAKCISGFRLYRLLEMFSVVKGEMLLIGREAWSLDDLEALGAEELQQLKSSPGILNLRQSSRREWFSENRSGG